jgi:hypothetical protein
LPTTPDNVTFELQLESADGNRKLVANCRCSTYRPRPNYVTRDAVHASLPIIETGPFYTAAITSHRRASKPLDPERRYTTRWLSVSQDELGSAFKHDGLDSVWRLLDNLWADFLAGRQPKSKPLPLVDIRIRCGVHAGRTVKVFTPAGACFGTVELDESENALILHESTGASRSIPAHEVREVVPYRI